MDKLAAGTMWGARTARSSELYTGAVTDTRDGIQLWIISQGYCAAAKTNTNRLTKVQNARMRIITGGMKTTPVTAMEESARDYYQWM